MAFRLSIFFNLSLMDLIGTMTQTVYSIHSETFNSYLKKYTHLLVHEYFVNVLYTTIYRGHPFTHRVQTPPRHAALLILFYVHLATLAK